MLAASKGIEYIDLSSIDIPPEVLHLVSEEFAVNRHVVPFRLENGVVHLAMEDPADLEAIEFVKKHTGYQVQPTYTDKTGIRRALRSYKKSLQEEFTELVEQSVATTAAQAPLTELAKDVSIVKAVDTLLEFAIVEGASDIHIESLPDEVVVRYRIDGVLHDVLTLPKELHPALVARIKILSNLKLDETRLPQDGRTQFKSDEGEQVSLRVSVLPSVEGEKVVMRVLEESLRNFSLNSLGFFKEDLAKVTQAIRKPHGMILVTGPTGSGKTTTLYTILGILNTVGVNISTVEDPVENRIRRVNQTQVNQTAGYTFASGLRSLLRQDPDIIMVGEIRDQETAKIAVNAAMTGHLVLSTLHTNDAPGTIPRLLDLGVEPFLLASTLELIVAQRLVRKICPDCKVEHTPEKDWKQAFPNIIKDQTELKNASALYPAKQFKGQGGPKCHYSGYKGRIGIFEVMAVDEKVRELISNRAQTQDIKAHALSVGMDTMLVDGIKKVGEGITTMEEVMRVSLE
jgi:type IV pilus assembly protein PilB